GVPVIIILHTFIRDPCRFIVHIMQPMVFRPLIIHTTASMRWEVMLTGRMPRPDAPRGTTRQPARMDELTRPHIRMVGAHLHGDTIRAQAQHGIPSKVMATILNGEHQRLPAEAKPIRLDTL